MTAARSPTCGGRSRTRIRRSRSDPVTRFLLCAALAWAGLPAGLRAQSAQGSTPASQAYKGLELTVTGIEHASSAALSDCPPGANTQRAMARPGEGFAIVTVRVKVLPTYLPAPLKRPVLTDAEGKTYNTAASFVDLAKDREFSCAFPFRIPEGTRLKSVQIETVSFDLTQP